MSLDLDRPVRLPPLTYVDDGDDVTVGRRDIDSYGLFPADGAALLRRLEAGQTPNEAARWYAERYGENVDMPGFLEVLAEYDLLLRDGEAPARPGIVRWQRLGRALFSVPAWVAYAALVATAEVVVVRRPGLAPRYQHLFFTHSSLVLLTLGIVLGQVPLILLHEAYHALAGRRLGLNTRLSVGRRFYYLVFVTTMDGLASVPRRLRYLPMLAGMLLDVLAIAALTLVAAVVDGWPGRYALCLAFGVVLRLAWQFYFFLQTDLYYLISTVLGCTDLQSAARALLRDRALRLVGRAPDRSLDAERFTARDRSVARWYAWLLVAGYGALGGTLVTVIVPAAIRVTGLAVRELMLRRSPAGVLDVLAFLVLNFGEFAVAGVLALRPLARRTLARRRPRPAN